jgi:chromosomal replication initiator protein
MEMTMIEAQEAWEIAYHQLELQLDRGSFDTWLRGAVFLRAEGNCFFIGVRNTYASDMLQHRLYQNIWRVLTDIWGNHVDIQFEVSQAPAKGRTAPVEFGDMPLFKLLAEQQNAASTQSVADLADEGGSTSPLHTRISRPERPALPESELNQRLTFDRYIVSSANRMAYEASRAVTEAPGRNYNPFLVYSDVGLGKTHLLQAIAHECQRKGLRVIYIPSEAFTNDLVDSIRQRTMAMFREKYRSADVLLIDDIQFISGKDSTQEEFFHTFNALYTFNKQIVLASDRHPSELSTLEDRLRSRFQGGLVVDIPMLDLETRIAILEMWIEEQGIRVPRGIIEMVAHRANHNIRALEGVFNQLLAKSHLTRQPLTMDLAAHTLQKFDAPRIHGPKITVQDVLRETARYYQLKIDDLTGKNRANRVNNARQVAMYLVRELTELSLPQIGDAFGGRSHTTVLHGCNKLAEAIDMLDPIGRDIEQIRHNLIGE